MAHSLFLTKALQIFDALSLTHITLGRSISSLSGGELQRLKLAKFILNNQRAIHSEKATVILDEPSRGLDDAAVVRLREAMSQYLGECSVIIIEHNPSFIYRCEYIIDLGRALQTKTRNSIVVGQLGEKSFPSLNHVEVFSSLAHIEKDDTWALPKNAQRRQPEADSEGKRYRLLSSLYVEQKKLRLGTTVLFGLQDDCKRQEHSFSVVTFGGSGHDEGGKQFSVQPVRGLFGKVFESAGIDL